MVKEKIGLTRVESDIHALVERKGPEKHLGSDQDAKKKSSDLLFLSNRKGTRKRHRTRDV